MVKHQQGLRAFFGGGGGGPPPAPRAKKNAASEADRDTEKDAAVQPAPEQARSQEHPQPAYDPVATRPAPTAETAPARANVVNAPPAAHATSTAAPPQSKARPGKRRRRVVGDDDSDESDGSGSDSDSGIHNRNSDRDDPEKKEDEEEEEEEEEHVAAAPPAAASSRRPDPFPLAPAPRSSKPALKKRMRSPSQTTAAKPTASAVAATQASPPPAPVHPAVQRAVEAALELMPAQPSAAECVSALRDAVRAMPDVAARDPMPATAEPSTAADVDGAAATAATNTGPADGEAAEAAEGPGAVEAGGDGSQSGGPPPEDDTMDVDGDEPAQEEEAAAKPARPQATKEQKAADAARVRAAFGLTAASAAPADACGGGGSGSGRVKKGVGTKTAEFSLTRDSYDPITGAQWKAGQVVPFAALASVFQTIEDMTGRLKIIETLSNLFRSVIALTPESAQLFTATARACISKRAHKQDLLPVVYLSINKLGPAYEGLELGIGEQVLKNALRDATGRTKAKIDSLYEVFNTLTQIATDTGKASMTQKQNRIQKLLVAAKNEEPKYIVRLLQGKLRIGLAEQSVIVALARAVLLTPPKTATLAAGADGEDAATKKKKPLSEEELEKGIALLKMVYSELPDYNKILPAILRRGGLDGLETECHLTPGIPVKPMLAKPTKGIGEVLTRFAKCSFTCEYKYDGERAQIHMLPDGSFHIFSRNAENHTGKYPDIIQSLPKALNPDADSFIIDCEAVAWDPEKKKILPFQILSHRARKTVDINDVKIRVCLFAFDMLYCNGESLLHNTFEERRAKLHSSFTAVEGELHFAVAQDFESTADTETEGIQNLLNEAIESSCEGLMVKTLKTDATYEPSKRSFNWLKVKKDYLQGLTDSFDLVPIGAYTGRGKRTGVYGGFLLACYDDESEEYQSICKIGTGFSEEQLTTFTESLQKTAINKPKSYYRFGEAVIPDVWFDTTQVWEVKAADLSISPVHLAAVTRVDPAKGVALRFPRFVRIRDDKNPDMATTAVQVEQMYRDQNLATLTPDEDEDLI